MCSGPFIFTNDEPIQTAMIEPTRYWPSPPMLNMPQRNANATASPQRMSGVVSSSVCWRLSAAVVRVAPVTHGKSQFSPVPLKIALYVENGFEPEASTTSPPIRKAISAVISGVTRPPARW